MRLEILLPFHRCDSFLFESIESLHNSSFQDFRILLVDDRQKLEYCESLEKVISSKKINYIRTSSRGYGNSLNTGIEKASAEYLAFMNSDDLVHSDRFKNQISEFVKFSCDIVTTKIQKFYKSYKAPQLSGTFTSADFTPLQLLFGSYSGDASAMFKTEWINRSGRFFNSDMADYIFALQNYKNARVRFINSNLYFYRKHELQSIAQPRFIPSQFFTAWNTLSTEFLLPTASEEVISVLSQPRIKTQMNDYLEFQLTEWIRYFFKSGIKHFSLTDINYKEYEDVIFRRLIAVSRNNPKFIRKLSQFFPYDKIFKNSIIVLSELTRREKLFTKIESSRKEYRK